MSADNAFCLGILASSGIVLLAMVLTQKWVNKKTEGGSAIETAMREGTLREYKTSPLPPDPAPSTPTHVCSKDEKIGQTVVMMHLKTGGIVNVVVSLYWCKACGDYCGEVLVP